MGWLLDRRGLALTAALIALPIAYLSAIAPLWTLVGAAALVLVWLVLTRAELVLLLLVAVLPWEGALGYPSDTLSVVKLLGMLLFVAWSLRAAARNERLVFPSTVGPVAAFGALVALSLLLSADPEAGVQKALSYVLFIVFFFLVIQLVRTRDDARRVARVFALSASAAAAYALYLFLVVGAIDRAAGPIEDPNDFAYLVASALPLVGYLMIAEPSRRVLWATCFVLLGIATLATLSRGALVGLGALLLWAVATRRVRLGGILLGLAALLSAGLLAFTIWAPLLNDRIESKSRIAQANVGARQALWEGALRMAADHPITGVGPAMYTELAPEYVRGLPVVLENPVVHNSYLEILAECGPLALLAFLAYLGGTWQALSRARRRADVTDDADLRHFVTALQGTMVIAIVSATFLSEQLTTPFWLIGALASVVAARASAEPARPERRRRAALAT